MQAHIRPQSAESKSRVLYLGSDLELVAALRKVLPEPDYQLVTGSDLESAILFLKSEIPYHLLLIDFEWRGREGLKVARRAHSLRHRKRMPIILVAKKLSSHVKGLARKASVNECVMKTGDMAAACKAIRQMIERKE